jgi:hypothetical protein
MLLMQSPSFSIFHHHRSQRELDSPHQSHHHTSLQTTSIYFRTDLCQGMHLHDVEEITLILNDKY